MFRCEIKYQDLRRCLLEECGSLAFRERSTGLRGTPPGTASGHTSACPPFISHTAHSTAAQLCGRQRRAGKRASQGQVFTRAEAQPPLDPLGGATGRHRLVLGWGDTQRRGFTATRGTRPVQGTNRGEGEEVKV